MLQNNFYIIQISTKSESNSLSYSTLVIIIYNLGDDEFYSIIKNDYDINSIDYYTQIGISCHTIINNIIDTEWLNKTKIDIININEWVFTFNYNINTQKYIRDKKLKQLIQ